ncbi:GNAT family N-acetyltransferase [Microbulbifer spongiae]|uniref:GNAT family N-acetyltransferase n=1 Tax=Microbulbifer spongiae TaxID=2944933 RepID=A0ABY9E9I0_9GAMM|nr:GNAT family N-acetyltransferase [Microbulbifer sp. MI-G]WKD49658.1 GNAT family N-acetyltransferase [Microbulbifer sp. MI-G]
MAFFESEWPAHYGPSGPGDALADLQSYAGKHELPIGLVAYVNGVPSGFMALKQESIAVRPELGPWAAAGYVVPNMRGRGLGSQLLAGIETTAANIGASKLYSGTSKAHNLLLRAGWAKREMMAYDGEIVTIYSKQLSKIDQRGYHYQ